MTLTPLKWHDSLWQLHQRAVRQQQLTHALLLVGEEGTGKEHYALSLAAKLLCHNKEALYACGQCHSCQLIDAMLYREGVHPDLHIIAPDKQGGLIKVDQIRSLDNVIRQSAQLSGYRVIIIKQANRLNINAANALLKNLEEPGNQTLFILLANNFAGILPTIRSRCQVSLFPSPSQEQALIWLRDQGLSKVTAEEALYLLGSKPLLIKQLSDDELIMPLIKAVLQLAAFIQKRFDSVSLVETWTNLPSHWLILVLNNLLHRLATNKFIPTYQSDASDSVLLQAEQIILEYTGVKQLCYLHQIFEQMVGLLMSAANPNPSLLWLEWLAQWQNINRIIIEEAIPWH